MIRWALLLAFLCVARLATASTGQGCHDSDPAFYGTGGGCWMLCDGISNGGGELECKTAASIPYSKYDTCSISISKAQTGCVTGDLFLEDASNNSSALPTVWATFCTLSGIVSPDSSLCLLDQRVPRRHLRMRTAAPLGASCTDVDIVIECLDLQTP